MDFELLTIGDASLDAFLFPTESETLCQLNDRDSLICFSYGDKIPVQDLEFSIGGNAANNAVGTRRLGIKDAICLTVGEDEIGDQIVEKLIKDNVDTSYIYREKDKRSNYSLALNYSGERTIFTYKDDISYRLPDEIPQVDWIYLTSMGSEYEKVYARIVDWVKNHPEVKLAFNPGSRQIRAGYEAIKNVLEVAEIVYVNKEEAEKISNSGNTIEDYKELLSKLSSLGPKVPVITDGPNGSFCLKQGKFYKAGILPVDAFERTGAGDAFGAGFLAATIKGKGMDEALLWGTVNSASVIGFIGAEKGLLIEDKMGEWLDRAKSSNVFVGEF